MATKTIPLLKEYLKFVKGGQGFERFARQIKIIKAGDGYCKAELKIDQEHSNYYNGLHGSCSVALIQMVSDLVLLGTENRIVDNKGNLNILFLKGGKKNDELVIEAKMTKQEQHLQNIDVVVTNKSTGDVIVKASNLRYIN